MGRVFLESRQLEIPHRFEKEPDDPDGQTDGVESGPGARLGQNGPNDRKGNEVKEEPLQQEDLEIRTKEPVPAPLLPPLPVAFILALAQVAEADVYRQPQSPEDHQQDHQPGAGRKAGLQKYGRQGRHDKSAAPGDIGQVIPAPPQGQKKPAGHIQ